MDIASVCLVGGTGFVGQAVAEQLSTNGLRVRVLTRYDQNAAPVKVLPTVEVAVGNCHDPEALLAAFEDMDAVVNCVGILHAGGRNTFQRVHAELPRKIVEACRRSGVQHVVHVSALGASAEGPSEYQRSKAAGEAALREAAGILPWTVLRPSVIFGQGDRFLNMFAGLVRLFPVVPLARPGARFQPSWVEDVGRAVAGVLGNVQAFGQAYDLCGPRVYTLEELVRYVAELTGRKPRIMGLADGLANLQAAVFEHLPGKLITRDNLRSMSVDNVCGCDFPALLGFQPAALEAVVPQYLTGASPRSRYNEFRYHAGRST
jgi:NADH dehydrogenase